MSNADIENDLQTLPDEVATALYIWRKAIIEREKVDAVTFLTNKAHNPDSTVKEIEAMVRSSDVLNHAKLDEALAESNYTRIYERLMSAKKLSGIRTAF